MNSIKAVTTTCEREDCSLTQTGFMSTCMGFTPTYNKYGERTDRGDPNSRFWEIHCSACKRVWDCREQYDETSITERKT